MLMDGAILAQICSVKSLMVFAPSGRNWLSFPDLFGSNHLDGQATGFSGGFFVKNADFLKINA